LPKIDKKSAQPFKLKSEKIKLGKLKYIIVINRLYFFSGDSGAATTVNRWSASTTPCTTSTGGTTKSTRMAQTTETTIS